MREVFISYSHKDNEPNIAVTHEVTEAVDHFLAVYRYVCDIPHQDGTDNDFFFMDRSSIRVGAPISESVRAAIDECSVMLAFYSPRYFGSRYCLQEWQEFNRARAAERPGRTPKLLIPIEVKPVAPDRIEFIDEDTPKWLDELTGFDGRRHTITSQILLDKDTTRLAHELEQLDQAIQSHILLRRGSSGERRSASNILAVRSQVERNSLNTRAIQDELRAGADGLKYNKLDPVCVLYAGGTVGMVHQEDSDVLHADYEMATGVDAIVRYLRPKLSSLPFDMHFFSLESPIDSSNVHARDWVDLATLIQEQMLRYQGFVVLHGTNTLAYSASAVSFLLSDTISRPVIFTGSEVPLSIDNTDAVHNVENAIRAAAWQSYNGPVLVPEVCVYWNNHLYRGNRVTKKYASDRAESFHTPNLAVPLATLANEKLNIDHGSIHQRPKADLVSPIRAQPPVDLSGAKVAVMFIHPEMDFDDLDSRYPSDIDGLILLSYGSGNVPQDPRFVATITRLIAGGTIVANVTQCPYGRVELRLFETSATLFDVGVLDAYDMTLEAAYTKLLWAIARRDNRRQPGVQNSIKRTFQRNIAGEMSASVYDISFGGSDTFDAVGDSEYVVSDVRALDNHIDRYDIAEVFVRLESVRFPAGTAAGQVRIIFGRPSRRDLDDPSDSSVLAQFSKSLTPAEAFDKNLEVTYPFRKWFDDEDFQVSIGLEGQPGIAFSSLRFVLYTKPARLR